MIRSKEFEQIIDKVYSNYLENFIIPETPIAIDVQPGYYSPMDREWFLKSILENNYRGKKFASQYGIVVDIKILSRDERIDIYCNEYTNGIKGKYEKPFDDFIDAKLTTRNIPTKLITITYNNEKIESYGN